MPDQKAELYPLILQPAYQHYLWGGNRIPEVFNRNLPSGIYAESWEVSDRPEGPCTVAEGRLSGWTLDDVLRVYGAELTGGSVAPERFPLLIKLIDARDKLSVQVHPNDGNASLVGGEAKTEAWYVLDAAPDAVVYAGFKTGVDETSFRRALKEQRVAEMLERLPVKRGDLICIPGGLVHAIGAGCLLLEVQQNSNTTYRVYDWDRVGADGNPRELHVEQAVKVMDWAARPEIRAMEGNLPSAEWHSLIKTPYFGIERLDFVADTVGEIDAGVAGKCHALFLAEGQVGLQDGGDGERVLTAGSTLLVPAAASGCRIKSAGQAACFIRMDAE